ncbi:MAG TPA: peptidoglycan-binding domain-containing protein [Bryobacteraceae bacterium]|nr:peptidoglycan-binding domain-containing protein [Bryobacteraceae bacterium]
MQKFIILAASLALAASAATTTKPPKQKVHKVSSKAPKSKAPKYKAAKSSSPKYKAPKYKSPKSKYKAPKARRSSQQAPTPDRYKEIQKALADRGYLHGEANGEWNADSTEALKRFQADQNLTPDGKINSLSLIAMGLGPKRMTAQNQAPPAPPEAPKPDLQR